ncbi:SIR2 family NAD-dependent protein deacylase [Salinilacihabitans rarus]|uniref:SIR2 family NAD-dependent protein deacylase n=1 Tax=Salinilacihabitans rarus TaxID=2961596 RepID=UPI0020C86987|nr:Sir2 family NAD-dependent protein deacetylase [Salinilacihabitans rarus]
MDTLEFLAAAIRDAETVVALTGAGVSAPSGVPTFRGDDGVWERFDEEQFTYGRFQRDPAGFWADRLALQRELYGEDHEPNAAHEALAALARDGYLDAILTQNTDGLHGRAAETADGTELVELHGNAHRVVCADCGRRSDANPVLERVADGDLPPRCDCGGVYRPDVVLFGQRLPDDVLRRSRAFARRSDVFLAIGSSLVVEPAGSLPRRAGETGATVGIVNLDVTPCDAVADATLREDVTEVLPRLRAAVEGERGG